MLKPLFSPIQINRLELKNRIVMPAMHFLPAKDGRLLPHHMDFFAERAQGGVALIIIGGCTIDETSGAPDMISVRDDRFLPELSALAKTVQSKGAKIAAQLFHGGRYVPSTVLGGKKPVSSSPLRSKYTGETPRELSLEEIKEIQVHYALAARRVQRAGFDAVEIIASAGYLISQFLSPLVNHRNDDYGGDFTKRMRFALEVARAVRQEVGSDFPVFFRVSAHEFMEGGQGIEETQPFCRQLQKAGVDMINVTGGWHETRVPQITMGVPRGGYVYLAQALKQVLSIPVMACNRINDPLFANQILLDGQADLIGFARGFIADPDLPNKALAGRFDEINRCIACNQGCFDPLFEQKPVTCLVNPRAGAESRLSITPATQKKKVMVIGGGPAGMEAARVAALRGHKVILYEKEERLGGQLLLAAVPPGRGEFLSFVHYLERQLEKNGVTVHLKTEVSLLQVEREKPDVIVLATGARAFLPQLKGSDLPQVLMAWDVLAGRVSTGKEVIVIGGGAVGLETALFLARKGTIDGETLYFLMFNQAESWETLSPLLFRGLKRITVIDRLKKFGQDIGQSTRWTILQDLSRFGVRTMAQTVAAEITLQGVLVERHGKKLLLPANSVVIATGTKPVNELWGKITDRAPEIYRIGDAHTPRKALEAVAEGFSLGRAL